jgi:hypothetical protein
VVAPAVVEVDEFRQPRFELAWPVIVFEQDPVLERVIALDFARERYTLRICAHFKKSKLPRISPEIDRLDGGGIVRRSYPVGESRPGRRRMRKIPPFRRG